jgi:hypothetical protein
MRFHRAMSPKVLRPWGIVLVVIGAVMVVVGPFTGIAVIGLVAGGIATVLTGAFLFWLGGAMKDVPAPPGGYGLFGGMRHAATQMDTAARNLGGMASSAQIAVNGSPARATINGFADTGQTMNFNPVVRFDLTVFPTDGRPPYPVQHQQMVPRLSLQKLAVGNQVGATVDRTDPAKLMLQL